MIIKSMSRKEPTFGQLIEYMSDIDKAEKRYNIHQNLYTREIEDIEREFQENARYMHRRKNGVYLYHEILSITKAEKLDLKKQKEALREIAYEYARNRANQNLIFGTLHDDHDEHLHYHLIISANAVGESKKTRLSKAQFDRFKKDMEKRVLKNYPELEQKVVINHEAKEKLSNKAYETKRRTKKKLKRDILKEKLQAIFKETQTKQAFFETLSKEKLEIYIRGKNIGIKELETGRKHRLKTLGLDEEFKALSSRIKRDECADESQMCDNTSETFKQEKAQKDKAEVKAETTATEKVRQQRKEEMETIRQKKAEDSEQDKSSHKK